MSRRLSVIVPTYNERENIGELIERIERLGLDLEIIIVDDSDTEETAAEAERLGAEYGNVRVLRRTGRRGLGSAIVDGIKVAGGNYIVVMDGDLQHPPEVLPDLYRSLEDGASIAIASRYTEGGGTAKWNALRRRMSRGATALAHLLLPETKCVKDPLSGFFAVKRGLIGEASISTKGYKVLLELLHNLSLVEGSFMRVTEVPFTFEERRGGNSKLGFREVLRYFSLLLELNEYRLVKFGIVGVFGIMVNEALLWAAVEGGVVPVLASPFAIEASILNNYILNKVWTFKARRVGYLSSIIKYHSAVIVGAIINYLAFVALTNFGLNYLTSNLLGILLGFMTNYLANEHLVWKPDR